MAKQITKAELDKRVKALMDEAEANTDPGHWARMRAEEEAATADGVENAKLEDRFKLRVTRDWDAEQLQADRAAAASEAAEAKAAEVAAARAEKVAAKEAREAEKAAALAERAAARAEREALREELRAVRTAANEAKQAAKEAKLAAHEERDARRAAEREHRAQMKVLIEELTDLLGKEKPTKKDKARLLELRETLKSTGD